MQTGVILSAVVLIGISLAGPVSGQDRSQNERDSLVQVLKESGDYETVGNVLLSVNVDPITDAVRASAIVPSVDLSRFGGGVMLFRCTDDKFEVYVNMREYLGDDRRKVYYRFDSNEPEEERWSASTDGTAVFARNDQEFARKAARAQQLAFRALDYDGTRHTVIFELEGLREALQQLPCFSLEDQ